MMMVLSWDCPCFRCSLIVQIHVFRLFLGFSTIHVSQTLSLAVLNHLPVVFRRKNNLRFPQKDSNLNVSHLRNLIYAFFHFL